MYLVVITYSFDVDMPVFAFDTEEEALGFLKKDFEDELKAQKDGNNVEPETIFDNEYAKMIFHDGDTIEWTLTYLTDRRSKVMTAYRAVEALEGEAPRGEEEFDKLSYEEQELYEECANFINAADNYLEAYYRNIREASEK